MFITLERIQFIINLIYLRLLTLDGPFEAFMFFLKHGGWLALLIALFWGFKESWLYWRQGLYVGSQKYALLAIDVPRENEQGPKAIENLFSNVYGAYKKPNLIEKYWDGFLCPKFSFELISQGGYLQFLIRTPVQFRDLVESSIYAQYPDAEISEVEDYAPGAPNQFKGTEYDMWGCEFVLYNDNCYPLKTYPAFEYGLTQEFKDPMGATLEIMSKISPDEKIWLQFVVTPLAPSWVEAGQKLVKKLIGAKVPTSSPGLTDVAYSATGKILKGAWEVATSSIYQSAAAAEQKKQNQEQRSEMLYLSPGERAAVEAIEAKISKNAFDTRFRFIYWGKREVFSKARGVNGLLGAIAQVNSLDNNGLKPHPKTKVSVDYFFVKTRQEWRRRRLMSAYKSRSNWAGWGHSTLNIEELATLWHFPMMDIRTPMLKKTQAKRIESPFVLPVEYSTIKTQAPQDSGLAPEPVNNTTKESPTAPAKPQNKTSSPPISSTKKSRPPVNLPTE